ncbi:MAG: FAD-dependent oxidoreductase [Methanobrevibacter sp.]|jgi:glycine/D-amino acid oxidase-like deaminating enzyme/nitrite reductase/ring-hydroxylating ferredoxin subunit|nr:FAD-dependent oxidoreductase [Methanobrevibacter sp.]
MIDGKHISVWLDEKDPKRFNSLKEDIEVDVAIVGGGIAGLSIATMLKMEGLNVAIAESNRIANYITGTTTAKITLSSSLIYNQIISNFGKNFALKFKEAYESGFNKIPEIIAKLNIDCDYRNIPFYIFSSNNDMEINLKKEHETLKELGINSKLVKNIPKPFDNVELGLMYENQAEFNPKKYLNALADYVDGEGSYVFEKTKIIAIDKYPVENKKIAIANNGKIIAKHIVIATNSLIYDPDEVYKYMTQNKSYLLSVYLKEKFPQGMFVDLNPFHTFRTTPKSNNGLNKELLIIAGEHHKVGDPDDTWDFYENMREFTMNFLDIESSQYYWTGGDNTTIDRIPIIGETSEKGIYIVTGFSNWGMTTGTIAGIAIKDLILKNENSYLEIFNPLRFKNKRSHLEEEKIAKFKGKVAIHWDSLIDGIAKLKNNEAKVVEFENSTIAIYKDNDSNIFALDGKCPHKSCNLRWNTAEKKWECPCHGAVFDYKGKVIRGPAIDDLKEII